jgi:hypothetical protein
MGSKRRDSFAKAGDQKVGIQPLWKAKRLPEQQRPRGSPEFLGFLGIGVPQICPSRQAMVANI